MDSSELIFSVVAAIVCAAIAYHGLTWRDEDGASDFVRMLFGAIALMFFFRFLLADILGVWG